MNLYLYIFAMAVTTYLIRMLPLTIFRKPIRSRFLKSFLHYVPYACLTAMTFPAILTSTDTLAGGVAALVVAVVLLLGRDCLEHKLVMVEVLVVTCHLQKQLFPKVLCLMVQMEKDLVLILDMEVLLLLVQEEGLMGQCLKEEMDLNVAAAEELATTEEAEGVEL